MLQFDGKKMQKYTFELWVDRWRSLAAEKGLQGQDAVWAMMEFIVNPALEKLHRRLGLRLREIEDPEEVIDELRAIYDVRYERPKLRDLGRLCEIAWRFYSPSTKKWTRDRASWARTRQCFNAFTQDSENLI